jgi:EpsI family protein
MSMKRSGRFFFLLIAILLGGALANTWAYLGEARVVRKELKEFPTEVGTWQKQGGDLLIDAQTMSVLRATDYVLRDYRRADGALANFYVGYYATQRDGATYHSPLNCLPGSGWVMNSPGDVTITPANGGAPFNANSYVIENGSRKSLLVYWYQGRGRRVASEYWGKVYTVLDSVRMRRSDAAMVRVVVPMSGSDQAALRDAADFAANAAVLLPEFVPD